MHTGIARLLGLVCATLLLAGCDVVGPLEPPAFRSPAGAKCSDCAGGLPWPLPEIPPDDKPGYSSTASPAQQSE